MHNVRTFLNVLCTTKCLPFSLRILQFLKVNHDLYYLGLVLTNFFVLLGTFSDSSKAVDKVWHQLLFLRLNQDGIYYYYFFSKDF